MFKRIILFVLPLIAIAFFMLPEKTIAATSSDPSNIISGISFENGSTLLEAGSILKSPQYTWVEKGWQVLRQMSNILIVIFLFLASVATTLNININTYGIKKILPSTIVGTLLANFSYFISDLFISLNNIIRDAFIGLSKPIGDASLSNSRAILGRMSQPLVEYLKGAKELGTDLGDLITKGLALVGVAIGLALMVFVVLTLMARNFIVAVLVVLAPIAFLAMATPTSESMFKKWWSEFIKWMFLPAIVGFFVMLGSIAVTGVGAGLIGLVAVIAALAMAARMPFILGGLVGAVAGKAWGLMDLKTHGQIAAQRAPVVGTTLRYFGDRKKQRDAKLSGLTSGPIKRRHRERSLRENAGGMERLWHGITSRLSNADNYVGDALNYNRVRAARNIEAETDEQKLVEQRADISLLANDEAYIARVGQLNASKDSFNKSIEGLKNMAEASALSTNSMIKNERALAETRKKMGDGLKAIATKDIGKDMLNENSEIGRYLTEQLGDTALERRHTREEDITDSAGNVIGRRTVGDVKGMLTSMGDEVRTAEATIEGEEKKNQYRLSQRIHENMATNISLEGEGEGPRADAERNRRLQGMNDQAWQDYSTNMADTMVRDGLMTSEEADAMLEQANNDPNQRIDVYERFTGTGSFATDENGRESRFKSQYRGRKLGHKQTMGMVGETNARNRKNMRELFTPEQRDAAFDRALDAVVLRDNYSSDAEHIQARNAVLQHILEGRVAYGDLRDHNNRQLDITAEQHDALLEVALPYYQNFLDATKTNSPTMFDDAVALLDHTPDPSRIGIPLVEQNRLRQIQSDATAGLIPPDELMNTRNEVKQILNRPAVLAAYADKGEVAKRFVD